MFLFTDIVSFCMIFSHRSSVTSVLRSIFDKSSNNDRTAAKTGKRYCRVETLRLTSLGSEVYREKDLVTLRTSEQRVSRPDDSVILDVVRIIDTRNTYKSVLLVGDEDSIFSGDNSAGFRESKGNYFLRGSYRVYCVFFTTDTALGPQEGRRPTFGWRNSQCWGRGHTISDAENR